MNYLDFTWQRDGFFKGDRIIQTLTNLIGDIMIEDLPMPYTAVAFDIYREKEVWIQSGPLFNAIRASISLPFIFTPYNHNGAILVDGGVLNPVPVAPVFSDDSDLIIAVNLGGASQEFDEDHQKSEKQPSVATELTEQVRLFLNTLQSETPIRTDQGVNPYEIYYQSFDAMQGTIARLKLVAYPPDKTVEIPRNACGTMEFYRSAEMISYGYEMAEKYLSE
jgi:NTE family protein